MNMVHYLILHMQISDNDMLFETVSIIRHTAFISPTRPLLYMWLYAKMQIIYHCLAVFNNNAIMPMNQIDSATCIHTRVLSNQVERKRKIVLRIK